MRQAASDHRVGQELARSDPQPAVVEEGALAAFGDEKLVGDRIVDHAGDDGAGALQPDRDGELRNAVQEIRGAVERIDDPGVGAVGALVLAAFFAEEAVARAGLGEFGAKCFLGLAIGGGDEIARALERDLEIFDLAEVALQCARGLARRGNHDVDERGVLHQSARPL